jgi:hypothetical protein
MKHLVLALFAAMIALPAHAAPKLNEGNWILGGAANFSFAKGATSSFQVSPEAEYFVIDNIALGVAGSYLVQGSYNSISIGPQVVFHMRASDTVVPYLAVKPIVINSYTGGGSAYYSTVGRVGVKFFLNDSVSFGPAAEWRHYWPQNGGTGSDAGSFLAVFTIHI